MISIEILQNIWYVWLSYWISNIISYQFIILSYLYQLFFDLLTLYEQHHLIFNLIMLFYKYSLLDSKLLYFDSLIDIIIYVIINSLIDFNIIYIIKIFCLLRWNINPIIIVFIDYLIDINITWLFSSSYISRSILNIFIKNFHEIIYFVNILTSINPHKFQIDWAT
jgi:hypothetical protein